MVKTYDQSCYDLALEFILDSGKFTEQSRSSAAAHDLALEIQETIEDFLAAEEQS